MYEYIFVEPWPWWVGGLLLGGFIIFYAWVYNRVMGMSSTVENAIQEWRDPLLLKAQPVIDMESLAAMLMAEQEGGGGTSTILKPENAEKASAPVVFNPRLILAGVLLGAASAAVLAGNALMFGLGAAFDQLFGGSTWIQAGVLGFGGVVAGFGARMAGGCPSGHALGGLSVLSPASLLAISGYFLAGIPLTLLLRSLS